MRRIILFIAMSLDGYIADEKGGVGWLSDIQTEENGEDSYSHFIKEIDTVVMGWNTYHQIVTELSPGEWVYKGLTTYILTHRKLESTGEICFTDENPCKILRRLKKEEGKSIWICGGADVIRQLMEEDLIDEYDISVIPVILGDGIRLFGKRESPVRLRLVRSGGSDGIVELVYVREKE